MPLAILNQLVTENLGIRIKIRILDSLFIDETRTKNIKNSQTMKVKAINLTIVLMVKIELSLGQFAYLNMNPKNE